jgi:hypothetical protein
LEFKNYIALAKTGKFIQTAKGYGIWKVVYLWKFYENRRFCDKLNKILCLLFRTSLIYINNCPTRCNTKSVYLLFCKFTLHVSGVNHTHTHTHTHTSSGVHKTVTAASGTVHIFCAITSHQRGQAWPRWREVEWTCRIINRLLCVASRWTIININ